MENGTELICFSPERERFQTPCQVNISKIDRYKWTNDLGKPGTLQWLDKKLLKVDRSYQRECFQGKTVEIAANWKWSACAVISVMRRPDGLLVVVDGQHRVLAAWKRSDITLLPCIVFESENTSEEASAFVDINTSRKAVQTYSTFVAKVVAGDSAAIEIKSLIENCGLRISPSGSHTGAIACVGLCQQLYRADKSNFALSLSVAASLAQADNTTVCNMLLSGLAWLNRNVSDGLANKRLLERLQAIGAKALVDNARKMSYRMGKGGAAVWAEGMLELVNRKLRNKITFVA